MFCLPTVRNLAPYPGAESLRPSRWGRQACHPADEELDDSLGRMTITVGIGAASHPLVTSWVVKERTHRSDNPLRIGTREAGGAGSDCFGAF